MIEPWKIAAVLAGLDAADAALAAVRAVLNAIVTPRSVGAWLLAIAMPAAGRRRCCRRSSSP